MKCPSDGQPLLAWNKPPSYFPWFCPNSDVHGGNGRFWTGEEIERAGAMSSDIEEMLPQLLDGSMTIPDGAKILARRSGSSVAEVQKTLESRVRMARNLEEWRSTTANAVDTGMSSGVSSTSRTSDPERVPPEAFMAVMTEHGLTKKQAAEAIGRSVSRVHELTVTQGGKQHLYDNFVQALEAYVRRDSETSTRGGG